MRPCIFLDRDGTLIEEVSYLSDLSQISFYEDVPSSLVKLRDAGYLLIVITNQSGVARGYFSTEFVEKTFEELNRILLPLDVQLDAQFYCPHHAEQGFPPYKKVCNCRKPTPGMIFEAQKNYSIDLSASFMLGDKLCDMELAQASKTKGLLLRTGHGRREEAHVTSVLPNINVFDSFSEATNFILQTPR